MSKLPFRKRMTRFLAILDARNKEFLRDTSALAWNFIFPVLVVVGFGFAFSKGNQDVFKVGVIGQLAASEQNFFGTQYVQFVPETVEADLLAKLKRHHYDMAIAGDQYWINSSSPKGYLLERILKGTPEGARLKRATVEGKEIRYVDWLISGMLAMNMMFSALFGVGYVIVRYRKSGVLKRLKATPLSAFDFLAAQVLSRIILISGVTAIVYIGCNSVIHFQMLGSYWDLSLVLLLGAMCLISVGLIVAATISSEEFAGGVLNLISWPMMFLSGVWFSLEGAHPYVQKLAKIFPLTHVIEASRAIMTEGATLAQVSPHLVILAVMTAVFMAVASFTFRWE